MSIFTNPSTSKFTYLLIEENPIPHLFIPQYWYMLLLTLQTIYIPIKHLISPWRVPHKNRTSARELTTKEEVTGTVSIVS